MAAPGTALRMFKSAFIDLLTSQVANVRYQSPDQPEHVLGEDGTGVAVFWGDDTAATIEVTVFTAGSPWFDETVVCTLIVQALGRTTDDDQETLDLRAAETLGHAIRLLAENPDGNVTDTADVQLFSVVPIGWRYPTGILEGSALRSGRYELDIELTARLRLA